MQVARAERSSAAGGLQTANRPSVRPVRGRHELSAFIKLPWRLYRGEQRWVAPLIGERRRHLEAKNNPFFEHAEAEYFLAWRGGQPVGRISAHIDERLNLFQGDDWGLFGFFEAENDSQIASALVESAADWLSARGQHRMVGPLDFSAHDECGLLVEGHAFGPHMFENWHHPYYQALLEAQGFSKAHDLYKWQVPTGEGRVVPAVYELADSLEPDHGITLRRPQGSFEAEVQAFCDVYYAASEQGFCSAPLTERELRTYARRLRFLIDPDFVLIAQRDGEPVGVCLALPDHKQVLAGLDGRLLPLGWLKALLARRKIDQISVLGLWVKPEYRQTPVAAAFYAEMLRVARRRGIRRAQTGCVGEDDERLSRAMRALGGRVAKRYRIYEREIGC